MSREAEVIDADVVVTIRDYKVIEKITQFISQNKLDPRVGNELFNIIYRVCWPFPDRQDPKYLLFDESLVDGTLSQIDISKCPKAPEHAETPASVDPVQVPVTPNGNHHESMD